MDEYSQHQNEINDKFKTDNSINKNFWQDCHLNKKSHWLTGTELDEIIKYHELDLNQYKDKRILEIGVGFGFVIKDLLKYTDKIICCDISEIALENVKDYALEIYLTTELKKIEPVDLAFCHLVLQHCNTKEVERIINDVNLTNDGILSFQVAVIREYDLSKEVKKMIKNGSLFIPTIEEIYEILNNTNKKIISESNRISHYNMWNFDWVIIKVKNK
jgi:SAM-dependent methyltransferase